MDMSLSNTSIGDFFNSVLGSSPPVGELVYTYTRPFLENNFLSQIQNLLSENIDKLSPTELDKVVEFSTEIGISMPDMQITYTNAEPILLALRGIYQIVKPHTNGH